MKNEKGKVLLTNFCDFNGRKSFCKYKKIWFGCNSNNFWNIVRDSGGKGWSGKFAIEALRNENMLNN